MQRRKCDGIRGLGGQVEGGPLAAGMDFEPCPRHMGCCSFTRCGQAKWLGGRSVLSQLQANRFHSSASLAVKLGSEVPSSEPL